MVLYHLIKNTAYARSMRSDKFLLSYFFEKTFIKKAWHNSYERRNFKNSLFAFISFSDYMITHFHTNDRSLNDILSHIKSEIDNKSSLVIGIKPSLECKRSKINEDDKVITGHKYTIIDYNE